VSKSSPTIVLVHGALTDASVWHGVIAELRRLGHRVLAPAIPMRGLASDVAYLRAFLTTVDGDITVAAHSYGGSVISDPDALTPAVRTLAFVAAFQQDTGETAGELNYRFPGSKLTPETTLVRETPTGNDMYLLPEHFAEAYAADVSPAIAAVMAAAQHPIDPAALGETFTGKATWRSLPSWALVSTADHSIPTEALRFMAERAGSKVSEIDSSHAVPVAHPGKTAELIAAAATG
jgi:pimeloyl-ACP methyl ester carboxylesterase